MNWFKGFVIAILIHGVPPCGLNAFAQQQLTLPGFTEVLDSAGTAEPVYSPGGILVKDFVIQASASNAGDCIIGASTVLFASGNGAILAPGSSIAPDGLDELQTQKFYNLNNIYFDCANTGDRIHGVYPAAN